MPNQPPCRVVAKSEASAEASSQAMILGNLTCQPEACSAIVVMTAAQLHRLGRLAQNGTEALQRGVACLVDKACKPRELRDPRLLRVGLDPQRRKAGLPEPNEEGMGALRPGDFEKVDWQHPLRQKAVPPCQTAM